MPYCCDVVLHDEDYVRLVHNMSFARTLTSGLYFNLSYIKHNRHNK